MTKPIKGKVAKIISMSEVAINVGSSHGVAEGMLFAILSKEPLVVTDPDSGEELGAQDRVKVRVKATDVYDRYSVCRTFEMIPGSPGLADIMRSPFGFLNLPATPPRAKTLKVDDSDLPEPLSEDESYVKVGDRVRQEFEVI